jgi:hypothetical protein
MALDVPGLPRTSRSRVCVAAARGRLQPDSAIRPPATDVVEALVFQMFPRGDSLAMAPRGNCTARKLLVAASFVLGLAGVLALSSPTTERVGWHAAFPLAIHLTTRASRSLRAFLCDPASSPASQEVTAPERSVASLFVPVCGPPLSNLARLHLRRRRSLLRGLGAARLRTFEHPSPTHYCETSRPDPISAHVVRWILAHATATTST